MRVAILIFLLLELASDVVGLSNPLYTHLSHIFAHVVILLLILHDDK